MPRNYGGYVILPILTNEFINKRNLITQEELLDFFALAQSLPGIIAANISMFIGYKLKGKFGALLAMFGVITVPFFCIITLASLFSTAAKNPYIQALLEGIGVAVIALILLTTREILQNTKKDFFFFSIFLLALFSLIYLNFSPIKTILIFTLLGVTYKTLSTLQGYISRRK